MHDVRYHLPDVSEQHPCLLVALALTRILISGLD